MKHYVYQITNLINGKTYIGVRSHPDPENDDYMSSSIIIKTLIAIHGRDSFKKEIIKEFFTREEAAEYERSFFTTEYLLDYNNYNRGQAGGVPLNMRKDIFYDLCEDIRNEYLSGVTQGVLAKKYNCDKGTIGRIINDIKRPLSEVQKLRFEQNIHHAKISLEERLKEISEDLFNELVVQYHSGRSLNSLAIENNIKLNTLRSTFIMMGIKLRKGSSHTMRNKTFKGIQLLNENVRNNAEVIISEYQTGATINNLSKKYNADFATIKRFINKYFEQNDKDIT